MHSSIAQRSWNFELLLIFKFGLFFPYQLIDCFLYNKQCLEIVLKLIYINRIALQFDNINNKKKSSKKKYPPKKKSSKKKSPLKKKFKEKVPPQKKSSKKNFPNCTFFLIQLSLRGVSYNRDRPRVLYRRLSHTPQRAMVTKVKLPFQRDESSKTEF